MDSNGRADLTGKKVVVFLGAGGVGKTTSAIALATLAAKEGRRVGLLSIDPAKRLAAALGIPLGQELREVKFPQSAPIKGQLFAAMLDQKAVFDAMVTRHAPSPKVAARILAHPLYQAASTKLGGPLEYMALAKLEDMVDDASYDMVVLDTPPDTQALDFLARPNILSGFMESRVMSLLVKPFYLAGKLGLARVMAASEKLMGGIAAITGVGALRSFAEFLMLMQDVIGGFQVSGQHILTVLAAESTAFCLVTTPTRAAARSAANIGAQLENMGHHLDLLAFNKCIPTPVAEELQAANGPGFDWRASPLAGLYRRLKGERDVTAGLADSLRPCLGSNARIVSIDEQPYDIHNADGVYRLALAWGRALNGN